MATVTIKGGEFALEQPRSATVRYEITDLGRKAPRRAFGAALGQCCPKLGRMLAKRAKDVEDAPPAPTLQSCGYDVARYAGEFVDALVEAGVPMSEILAAGATAFDFITEGLVSAAEVKEAEGNSSAPAGADRS